MNTIANTNGTNSASKNIIKSKKRLKSTNNTNHRQIDQQSVSPSTSEFENNDSYSLPSGIISKQHQNLSHYQHHSIQKNPHNLLDLNLLSSVSKGHQESLATNFLKNFTNNPGFNFSRSGSVSNSTIHHNNNGNIGVSNNPGTNHHNHNLLFLNNGNNHTTNISFDDECNWCGMKEPERVIVINDHLAWVTWVIVALVLVGCAAAISFFLGKLI